ncbi:DEAD-box ATP-dependent RNA helicase 50 [Arabidopsis thaliana]|uniref:DEAD-box ATP-dependent RNA helicase 50 n=4 Tax=Arabidopsis TaxID=3701 RepID=RH50_ARATH|nr:DEA(D/H)-box RNA helicase family protein [Arabidopsis thaliana]Q8GUG7.2 RecName: Full=DEAD-box ATP-dependent RNA helicase 50 [Arabidopsis thaliana]KAG7624337.1 Helicase superfamily 1/2 ATP-binding domain [Arabidopsis thaliana x Arabidopsis arenosa]KAG7630353.1 Helicase superfamily 1/2 ATP-binding domain [Arabidopsis suecica]AAF27002.1 putative DEAD/DEAH box helicase [Arabidopsis thaliana]AAK82522.1 AT3g06980/F17A9_13 [Arabidopsis thaliana]AAM47372.1 AT3g06980/F17A9_13 [Arabidopsis thaliana|eukprot:NP_187354.1 DEA(D/H)-box RNA helicase family protein [Arabidopsis thaliana]
MLARAPPPYFNFPARNNTICNRNEIVRLFRNGGGVVARGAGFTRRPLETSSSYDDSTDDGFVIISAADKENEFAPPPSSDLLSSIPSESARRNGSRSRGLTASFGRLKAQKVKALVGKVTQKKQHMSHNEEEDEDDASDENYSADEGFGSSSILDLMRKKLAMKAIPRSGKSAERNEVKRASKVRESRESRRDLDRLEGDDEDVDEVSNPDRFTDNQRAGSRSSYSKGGYAANSRGKGDRLSVARDLDSFEGHGRAIDEVSNPRKFNDNERAESRSSYSRDSSANSRGREDRRFVAKELDTFQGRDKAYDEVYNPRRFTDNERGLRGGSHSKGSDTNSRGWGDRRSVVYTRDMDDWRERNKTKDTRETGFFSRKTFAEIGCSEDMMKALKEQNFDRPAHIQAMAFSPVIDGKSCIIADQSGSGKTLAYLVPVIQRLREEELQGHSKSSPGCPRVIVLVPTAELASQVLANCRSISKSGVPFRSMVVTGGFRQRTQLENLEQGVDVLIATPGRFTYLMNEGILGLSNLRCAILDEVDILFGDDEFEAALQNLINSSPVTAQYLFVTATLPLEIYNKLVEVFPDCEVVMGPRVHRVSNALEEFLVDCSGDDNAEKTPETAFQNKKTALLQIMEENPVSKTIIFCNKIETCRKVENIFKRVDRKERQLHVLPFHAALSQESRLTNMQEFTSSQPEENSLFLVCTDRASRGIDFSGVDHVVLFDFPRDPSEYVRRVGRTARGARGKGKAFIFVVGKQVGLARRIIERNEKGHPVHDVPNAYEFTT